MKSTYKVILSRGDTVGGKQVQNDKVRDCHATLAMTRGEQHGRSMVEMLGVLAVIGVLSVAGIAGYSIAMRSYRTNEIVNAVSTLYVMGLAQNQGAGDQELVYAGNIATNNPSGVTDLKYTTSKTVTMTISDADDCAMVKAKLGDKITGECASLTVTLGNTSTPTTPETPTPETPVGDCSTPGKYKCGNGNYGPYTILRCDRYNPNTSEEDPVGYWWGSHDGSNCQSGCADSNVHNNYEDTCVDKQVNYLE